MLDDDTGGILKGFYALKRRVSVSHVIERERFALKRFGRSNAWLAGGGVHIESRFLMRVFTVTHVLLFMQLQVEGAGKGGVFAGYLTAKIVGDGAVVTSGMLKRFNG